MPLALSVLDLNSGIDKDQAVSTGGSLLEPMDLDPNLVFITTPHPTTLITKENKDPMMGINPMSPTKINPNNTAGSGLGCLLLKARYKLSPKKWKTIT